MQRSDSGETVVLSTTSYTCTRSPGSNFSDWFKYLWTYFQPPLLIRPRDLLNLCLSYRIQPLNFHILCLQWSAKILLKNEHFTQCFRMLQWIILRIFCLTRKMKSIWYDEGIANAETRNHIIVKSSTIHDCHMKFEKLDELIHTKMEDFERHKDTISAQVCKSVFNLSNHDSRKVSLIIYTAIELLV